jgi:hypothetical protein
MAVPDIRDNIDFTFKDRVEREERREWRRV